MMTIDDLMKPPLDELMHYGKKGMRWGVITEEKKSTHRMKLEAKYQANGLSKQKAEEQASHRIRVEKILIASAALTLTAAAVIVIKNERAKNWTDTTLKAGTIFKRMAQTPDGDLSAKTFVSFLDKDSKHYEALRYGGSQMYQVSLKSVNKIVVPSNHTVNKLWGKVVKENATYIKKDPNIRQFANTLFSKDPEIVRASIGVIPRNSPLWTSFSIELKKAGFNAVTDYTDSGGGAVKPLILLDAISDVINIGSRLMS